MKQIVKKTKRGIGCFLFSIFLCVSVFAFAQDGHLSNANELFPIFSQWMNEGEHGTPYQIEVTAAIHALSPFTEETVASLNRLVSAMGGELYLAKNSENTHWQTTLLLENQPLIRLGGVNEERKVTQWVNIKGVPPLFSTTVSPLYDLLGVMDGFEQGGMIQLPSFGPIKAGIEQLFSALTVEGIEKNSSYQFKNIGKAGKLVTYAFDENTILQFQTLLSNVMQAGGWQWGMVQNNAMVYNGKGSLKAYYTKEGDFLGMEAQAKALAGEEERLIEWMWATNGQSDRFILSLPTAKGNKQFSLEGEVTADKESQQLIFSGKYKQKNEDGKMETQLKGSLSGAMAENNERITGEIVLTTTKGEDVTTLTLQPSIVTMAQGEISPKGSVRITKAQNKKITADISLSLITTPSQGEAINLSMAQDYDGLTPAQKEGLKEQITMGFSSAFVKAALTLPQEDISFILEGLTQENIEEVYRALP